MITHSHRDQAPASTTDQPEQALLNGIGDHGDDKASRKAAQEMVTLAHMAFLASLTSNHTKGLAIDMDVSWKGDLFLKVPGQGCEPVEDNEHSTHRRW